MKKAAVLRCLMTSVSCAGTGCFRACREKDGAFARYGEEPVELVSVWTCNGCGPYTLPDPEGEGLQKKIDRMSKAGVDVVHLSNCTRKKNAEGEKVLCRRIGAIADKLRAAGIEVVEGTH